MMTTRSAALKDALRLIDLDSFNVANLSGACFEAVDYWLTCGQDLPPMDEAAVWSYVQERLRPAIAGKIEGLVAAFNIDPTGRP
jgi:hypothetical protein